MRSKAAIAASKAAFAEARPAYSRLTDDAAGYERPNNAERPAYFNWAPAPAAAPPPTPEWPAPQPPRSAGRRKPPAAAVNLLEDHVRGLLLAPPPPPPASAYAHSEPPYARGGDWAPGAPPAAPPAIEAPPPAVRAAFLALAGASPAVDVVLRKLAAPRLDVAVAAPEPPPEEADAARALADAAAAIVPRRPPPRKRAPAPAPTRRFMRINGGPPGRPAAVRRAFAAKAQTVVRKQQRALRNAAPRTNARRAATSPLLSNQRYPTVTKSVYKTTARNAYAWPTPKPEF